MISNRLFTVPLWPGLLGAHNVRRGLKAHAGLRAGVVLQSIVIAQIFLLLPVMVNAAGAPGISSNALAEIQALEQEKAKRTPAQQKIDSNLLYAHQKLITGMASRSAPHLQPDVKVRADGRVLVDIAATVSDDLLAFIKKNRGQVISSFAQYNEIRALVPLPAIESIAGRPDVRFVDRAHEATHNVTDPEGDVCHAADQARAAFGGNGTGVKVGVLSDSVDYLANAQAAGDLGSVTVLAGQSGVNTCGGGHDPCAGEGTAMLDIVHRLAPGAQLYFATGEGGPANMAANILDLATAGCSIIVDDLTYLDESPFQDGQPVAQAVKTVSDQGVLYFSSAGNSGNKDSGTSGTWEGDFFDGGAAGLPLPAGRLHDFGGGTDYNTVTAVDHARADLFWSDPLGASSNDYNLYVLNSTGTTVLRSSTTTQSGPQNPYESVSTLNNGERIVILQKIGAAGRFLHLDTGRCRLAINTTGYIRGHNCANAANAFCVAATDVANSYPSPFTGGVANPVEWFSSDGPRRLFFNPDGTAITSGNFSSTGGIVLQKPDITAADGVTTTAALGPDFNPFFGTSAAAPHAAAIAALMISFNPTLTANQVRTALTNTALDIMAAGFDRDSGAGIVMANRAISALAGINSWIDSSGGRWEDAVRWSGGSPSISNAVCLIANAPSKTVTNQGSPNPSTLTISNLVLSAPVNSTNTLLFFNLISSPLTILNSCTISNRGSLSMNNGTLVVRGISGGELRVDGGALLTNNAAIVATNSTSSIGASSSGSLTVKGGSVLLTNLYIGSGASQGTLTVVGGTVTASGFAVMGGSGGGTGTVWVTGGNLVIPNLTGFDNDVYVGLSGVGKLTVSNGTMSATHVVVGYSNKGTLTAAGGNTTATRLIVGHEPNSTGTLVVASGQLVVTNAAGTANLIVGRSGRGTFTMTGGSVTVDQLLVTNGVNSVFSFNGGTLTTGSTTISNGQDFIVGNTGGSATLQMVGGTHTFATNLVVGNSGAGNRMVISNQAQVFSSYCFVGSNFTSSGNSVLVTGAGSVWSNRSGVRIGYSGAGNSLVISNQGVVVASYSSLGYTVSSSNNNARVVDNGRLDLLTLYVGINNSSNVLTISGGSVLATNVFIGYSTATNNVIQIDSGSLFVTNALGTGELVVRRVGGKASLIINGGSVTVDKLTATGGVNSVITFNGGAVHSKATAVTNTLQFVIGDGTSAANFHLLGGIHSFNNGARVRSNAVLSGCGTINGRVSVDPTGTVLADCGGTLTFTSILTNNGLMRAINGSTLEAYSNVVNNGTIDIIDGSTNFHGAFTNNGTVLVAGSAVVKVVGSSTTVRPNLPIPSTATNSATLVAAKNEFESFQIVIRATGGALTGVTVTNGTPLTSGTDTIPATNITFYREVDYNVVIPSDAEGATGPWPDALIPDIDPFYHQKRTAFPYNLAANSNLTVWVDIQVPQNQPAGVYVGSVVVSNVPSAGMSTNIPVRLTVANFVIPSTASLKSLFPTYRLDACKGHTTNPCNILSNEDQDFNWKLQSLYASAALDNRVTISNPDFLDHGNPPPAPGTAALTNFNKYVLPLLRGTSDVVRLPGARMTSFHRYAWDCLEGCMTNWENFARANGFYDIMVNYACDEPCLDIDPNCVANTPTQRWSVCAARLSWPTKSPKLVTKHIQAVTNDSPVSLPNIDTLVPVGNRLHDKPDSTETCCRGDQRSAYDSWLDPANNTPGTPTNQLWVYESCFSFGCSTEYTDPYWNGWPGYAIDAPPIQARAFGWLCFQYDLSGELTWETTFELDTSWTDSYYSGGNGDGTLFYPGIPAGRGVPGDPKYAPAIGGSAGSDIPIESIRLKRIRDGREDYELLKIMADAGRRAEAITLVESIFGSRTSNSPGPMFSITSNSTMVTEANIETARSNLVAQINGMLPETFMPSCPSSPLNSTTATVSFSGDCNCGFECSLDGAAFSPCSSPKNYPGLTNATYMFRVRATNSISQIDPTPAQCSWTVSIVSNAAAPTGKIVFMSKRDDAKGEIYIMNADGSGIQRLTTSPGEDSHPALSHAGKTIAFTSARADPNPSTCNPCNTEIYLMNIDGSDVQRLTNSVGKDEKPAWSPDDSKIAFVSDRNGNDDIFVMNAAPGAVATNLTTNNGGCHDYDPVWSPAAQNKIAFSSARDCAGNCLDRACGSEIYVMDATPGAAATRLTFSAQDDDLPSWSHNGSNIVFDSYRDNNYEIYVMNAADGSGLTNLTQSISTHDYDPVWSSDDSQIAFTFLSNGVTQVWAMNADGGNRHSLTPTDNYASAPDWGNPLVVTDVRTIGGDIAISFNSVLGLKYRVETTGDLTTSAWGVLTNNIGGTGGSVRVIDPGATTNGPARYYRVRLVP